MPTPEADVHFPAMSKRGSGKLGCDRVGLRTGTWLGLCLETVRSLERQLAMSIWGGCSSVLGEAEASGRGFFDMHHCAWTINQGEAGRVGSGRGFSE